MTDNSFSQLLRESLARREKNNSRRVRREITPIDATHVEIDGKRLVNFASNDYLGLTHHPRVIEAAKNSLQRHGAGSGAAALISGYTASHASAEAAIATLKGCESAVLLPSGYQANHAAIQTVAAAASSVRFLVDKLAHASLIDALRASGSEFRVFPHNHIGKLERLLAESSGDQLQVVVTESIFSMDGDAVDLRAIAELKKKYPFVLILDEAHGTGVYGVGGAGYASEMGLSTIVDVSIVTLSKAIGCIGGAVCGSKLFCESLINHGRAYIYSTSVPPFVADAAIAAIDVMRDEPQRQHRVRQLAKYVREKLGESGTRSEGTPEDSDRTSTDPSLREYAQTSASEEQSSFEVPSGDSPIIPIILRDEKAALSAASKLQQDGLLVVAVRPPTVPKGTSRLRVTLSCEHTDEEVDRLIVCLKALKRGECC